MYKKVFKNSLKNFRFILLVPETLKLLATFVLGVLFVKLSGIYSFWRGIDFVNLSQDQLIELIKEYSSTNYMAILFYGALFFTLNFVIGAQFISFKYLIIRDILKKAKINIYRSFRDSKKFVIRVILLRALFFLIGLLIILAVMVLFSILAGFGLRVWALATSFIFLLLLIFLFQIYLYCVYPIMFLDNKKVIGSMKRSFSFSKKNFYYIFVIWLLSILLLFFSSLVIDLPRTFFFSLGVLSFIYTFFKIFVNFLVGLYLDLVRFYAYKLKR